MVPKYFLLRLYWARVETKGHWLLKNRLGFARRRARTLFVSPDAYGRIRNVVTADRKWNERPIAGDPRAFSLSGLL